MYVLFCLGQGLSFPCYIEQRGTSSARHVVHAYAVEDTKRVFLHVETVTFLDSGFSTGQFLLVAYLNCTYPE